ncbi:probable 3-hydroxyisobutyrate dehydrogenase, mitochondrial isoform X3 [Ananas comosus]|uniref:3-hydroxyisobutyrate dehydrogenase n=1 Tax=Ananas comosus TaxID=4615 RepID=A0A6P5GUN2_ANACO|nr:probable 3-hydroxyisobutyrate dehydrogenase, mitochondrial isoform X3 [Ananas comosus]
MASRGFRVHRFLRSCDWIRLRPNLNRGFSSDAVPSQLERVGFIGLGNMGYHMAKNLITAGYKVTVHDIVDRQIKTWILMISSNDNTMKKFSEKGVPTKETPCQVAESSDVIITMLPTSSNVLDVYFGQNGLIESQNHLSPWLFIDSSTVDPQTSRKISMSISKCHLKEKKGYVEKPIMLDAPVSGGVPAAEAGTLTFMAAKICNNLAMAISMIGVSEAFALGQNLGIRASTLTNIFNSSSARCWSSDTYNPVPGVMPGVPSSRNYDGGFASKLMAKDLGLAITSAAEVGLESPLTSKAHNIYKRLCEKGYDSKDFSCVFRHYYSGKDEN